MSTEQPTAPTVFSVRLSPAALARIDEHPAGRSAGLRAAIGAVANGETPTGHGPRSLVQVSAKVSSAVVDRARAAAAAHVPPLKLPEAIEAVLLEGPSGL